MVVVKRGILTLNKLFTQNIMRIRDAFVTAKELYAKLHITLTLGLQAHLRPLLIKIV